MDTLIKLLDAARKTCSTPTDMALAARLEVSRQAVSEWRSGAKRISDDHLARLIALAHAPKSDAILVHTEQAKSDTERKLWASLAKQLGVAATVAAAALLATPLMGGEHQSAAMLLGLAIPEAQALDIMRNTFRWYGSCTASFPNSWNEA